jgi:hypothetical protein
MAEESRLNSRQGHIVETGSGTYATSYPISVKALSQGLKRLGREADHSPLSSTDDKGEWSFTSTPHTSS